MPISSGAEGHVGVGVDTSIKWIPDGGTDFPTPRDVNSYLQRYLDSFPQARKRNIEGNLQRASVQDHLEDQEPLGTKRVPQRVSVQDHQADQEPLGTKRVPQDGANHHEALLETEDSQLVTNNQNTTKGDGKTPKRKIQQEEGTGSPRISDVKTPKHKNQQQEHQGKQRESGTDSKTPKRKIEQHQDLASPRKSDVKTQKLKNDQPDDLTSTRKSEHEAYQGNNEEAPYREAQLEAQASSPTPADSTSAAKDGGSTKGKGSKTGAKSSTCTVL
ncbi:uncharacterized protein LOC144819826 isoform X1 [Lissotriton helveticus]